MEGDGFLMVLPKLYAFSGEAHHALRSRPKNEHSFSLGFFFQSAAAEALPEGPVLGVCSVRHCYV